MGVVTAVPVRQALRSFTGAPSRPSYVVACLCSLSFLTIVDRVCISAAKTDMSRELGITDTTFGWVFGAFAFGYTLMMVPSGWLVDRSGPRKMLALFVLLWSFLTAATGWINAAAILLMVRFLFGVAEAGAFPGAARAISNWLPIHRRGLALGLLNTGSRLGAAFGLWAISFCVAHWGWRFSFLLLGIVGAIWATFWYVWFRDHPPANQSSVSAYSHTTKTSLPTAATMNKLSRSGTVYLVLFQYFASNFTFFICFSWLLPYLKSHYGLTNTAAGMYAAIPLYFGALATWISGTVVDFTFRKGHWKLSRRLPAMFGFGLAAGAVVATAFSASADGFIFCFSLATFGVDLTLSPSWTVCADIGGIRTGALSGAMNMMGSLGAFASSVLFPLLLDSTGDIKMYFYLAASLDVAAMVGWGFVLGKSAKVYGVPAPASPNNCTV